MYRFCLNQKFESFFFSAHRRQVTLFLDGSGVDEEVDLHGSVAFPVRLVHFDLSDRGEVTVVHDYE
jgi:hypothetical protein